MAALNTSLFVVGDARRFALKRRFELCTQPIKNHFRPISDHTKINRRSNVEAAVRSMQLCITLQYVEVVGNFSGDWQFMRPPFN